MNNVYKVVELVGSSTDNVEDAIQTAIKRADETLRNLRWFGGRADPHGER